MRGRLVAGCGGGPSASREDIGAFKSSGGMPSKSLDEEAFLLLEVCIDSPELAELAGKIGFCTAEVVEESVAAAGAPTDALF